MTRALRITAGLLLVACSKGEDDSTASTSSIDLTEREQLLELASEAGWTARPGAIALATMEHCCEPLVHCLGADPAAPYRTLSLPPAPEQAAADPDLYWMWGEVPDGTTRDFRLRPDEAVVWIGTAPPEVDYFGFQTLLSTRPDETGSRERVLGALGAPLNQHRIAAERGVDVADVWDQPLITLTSADQVVEDQVRTWLVQAGYPAEAIHTDRIPGTTARLGLDLPADTFVSLAQTLDPVDPAALDAWTQAPSTVLRFTPGTDAASPSQFGEPALPPQGTGVYEDYADALEELRLALRAQWSQRPALPGVVAWDWHHTFACLVDLDCQADTHDRLRAESVPFPLDGSTFAVAYGVNHAVTGKSTATTLAVHRKLTGTGVAWIDDEALVGTARAFLGDAHPQVDELYAVILSRDCSFFTATCVEIPSTCPGPLTGEDMYLSWSLYVEPETGVAPLAAELTIDRVLKFFPEAD